VDRNGFKFLRIDPGSASGFSIVGLLAALALLAIAIVGIQRSFLMFKRISKTTTLRSSSDEIEESFCESITKITVNYFNSTCTTPANVMGSILNFGKYQLGPFNPAGIAGLNLAPSSKPVLAGKRCEKPRFASASAAPAEIYFCKSLTTTVTAATRDEKLMFGDSLANASLVFVEILGRAVNLIDVQTKFRCDQFASSKTAGVQIYYTFHLNSFKGPKAIWTAKSGVIYSGKGI